MFDCPAPEGYESCLSDHFPPAVEEEELPALTKKPSTYGDKHVTAKDEVFM